MTTRTMTLTLDDEDFDAIQKAITEYQLVSRNVYPNADESLPEGESCLAGAIIAELIRDLNDYRAAWEAANPV